MSIIVVSDVHLGSQNCNHYEFCEFIDWIMTLKDSPKEVCLTQSTGIKKITIKYPNKIILLGDIVEMWDPKNGDRDHVVEQSFRPVSMLSAMDCDKIYVIGNHDNAISSYSKIDFEKLHGAKFKIQNRHYPEDLSGIKVGNRSYFFLHGHQFDKGQELLTYFPKIYIKIMKIFYPKEDIGTMRDPLGWLNAQYNIRFSKKLWAPLLGVLIGLIYLGWYIFPLLTSKYIYILLFSVATGILFVSSIPAIITKGQRRFYDNFFKPKDRTAKQIIEEEYYKNKKDTTTADVVVFGHTHFPSSYQSNTGNEASKNKLFINSGSWVEEDKIIDGKIRYKNTFIYIDEDGGAYICRWRWESLPAKYDIQCIEAFH